MKIDFAGIVFSGESIKSEEKVLV